MSSAIASKSWTSHAAPLQPASHAHVASASHEPWPAHRRPPASGHATVEQSALSCAASQTHVSKAAHSWPWHPFGQPLWHLLP
jgi:hypothetical protein